MRPAVAGPADAGILKKNANRLHSVHGDLGVRFWGDEPKLIFWSAGSRRVGIRSTGNLCHWLWQILQHESAEG